jgi:hypothetical protein
MGVYHFMGLGRAVGAATCAVDYVEKALDKVGRAPPVAEIDRLFSGSGGIRHEEADRGKVEAIVLFDSPEVIDGELPPFEYSGCRKSLGSMREEMANVLRSVWRRKDEDEGRKVFWCKVDIDNFQDCFEKVIRATYRFSPPGKQGKEIWCNLTGGSNSIGMALLSMARLTGKSTKHYLISQSKAFQREVTVPKQIDIRPDRDGYFNIVPFLKTNLDLLGLYKVLEEMADALNMAPVKTDDLFSRLRWMEPFSAMAVETFKRDYMLRLSGLGYVRYDIASDVNELTEDGWHFFTEELERWKRLLNPNGVDFVAESKTWSWFSEETI